MLHACSIFWSYHPCYSWTKHITSTSSYSMCPRLEKKNKILVMLVFSHQQSPCTWSLPCLMSRTHFKQSMGESVNSLNFYKCSELLNQSPNSKPRRVWQKEVTSPLKASSQESSSSEWTEVLDQWISQGEVQSEGLKTPNPHRKS